MGTLKPLIVMMAAALAATPALAAKPDAAPVKNTLAGDFLIAQAAEHEGDWATAGRLLTKTWAESHDPDMLREAFLISLGAGDIPGALSLAASVRPNMPEAGLSSALRAADAIRRGDTATARKLVAALPDKSVSAPLKAMLTAWMEADKGDRAAALASLDGLKEFDSFRQVHAALIEEFLANRTAGRKHDYSRADAAYALLAEGAPVPRVASEAADYYRRTGRPVLAAQILSHMTTDTGGVAATSVLTSTATPRPKPSLISGAAEAFYNMAELLLEADHPDVALFYAEIARHLDPAKPDTHLLLGEIEQAEGRHVQAAADFLAVQENSDFGLLARLDAVLALDDSGATKQALATAQALVKGRPTLPEPAIELGDLERRHDHYAAATEAYDLALKEMKPNDSRRANVIFARGIDADSLHDDVGAEADLKQAVALAPDQPTILNYLGYFWASRDENLDQAQTLLEHAWKLAPTDGAIADSLGWVLYQRGDYRGAIEKLQDAVQLMPGDSEINAHLGDAYWQVGRKTDARFQWRHALLNAPSDSAPILKVKLNEGLVQTPSGKALGENHAEVEIK